MRHALGNELRTGLSAIPGVDTFDLGGRRCAVVTAAVTARNAAEVAAELATRHINVSTTVPEHDQLDTEDRSVHPLVRFSPHYFNTEEEIGRCIDAVAELAGN